VAAGAVGGAFMWLIKLMVAHFESDLAYTRKTAERGTELAEHGAEIAEKKA
jgi:hypothetical protein